MQEAGPRRSRGRSKERQEEACVSACLVSLQKGLGFTWTLKSIPTFLRTYVQKLWFPY